MLKSLAYGLATALLGILLSAAFHDPLFSTLKWLGFDPSSMSTTQMLITMALVMFALGFASAFFFVDNARINAFFHSRRISSLEQIEGVLEQPVITWIPAFHGDARQHLEDPKSSLMESLSSLASHIQFRTGRTGTLLLVTSGGPAEGKSTVANGIARIQARKGRRVLLVDTDMRSPSVSRMMKVEPVPGLSDHALRRIFLDEIIHQTDIGNLHVICAGSPPPSPDTVIDQLEVDGFWSKLLDRYDWVVVDGPPVLGLADAPAVARSMTTILFVVRYRVATAKVILSAFRRIFLKEGQMMMVAGTALPEKDFGYGYVYSYNYGELSNEDDVKLSGEAEGNWRES